MRCAADPDVRARTVTAGSRLPSRVRRPEGEDSSGRRARTVVDDGSKKALAEIYAAGDVDHARAAAKALAAEYGVRWPRRRRRSPTTSTCYSLVRVSTTSSPPSTGSPADHEPARADLRPRPLRQRGTKARLPGRRPGDGVQAVRIRASPLEGRERTSPRRARPRRRPLAERQTRRTSRRIKLRPPSHLTRRSKALKYSSRRPAPSEMPACSVPPETPL